MLLQMDGYRDGSARTWDRGKARVHAPRVDLVEAGILQASVVVEIVDADGGQESDPPRTGRLSSIVIAKKGSSLINVTMRSCSLGI